jgi:hypothetical protein
LQREALAMQKALLASEHPAVAASLNNLFVTKLPNAGEISISLRPYSAAFALSQSDLRGKLLTY